MSINLIENNCITQKNCHVQNRYNCTKYESDFFFHLQKDFSRFILVSLELPKKYHCYFSPDTELPEADNNNNDINFQVFYNILNLL